MHLPAAIQKPPTTEEAATLKARSLELWAETTTICDRILSKDHFDKMQAAMVSYHQAATVAKVRPVVRARVTARASHRRITRTTDTSGDSTSSDGEPDPPSHVKARLLAAFIVQASHPALADRLRQQAFAELAAL